MSQTSSHTQLVSRRGELLAELFLQDLNPEFVTRTPAHFAYDFFVGFQNPRGGLNNIAVEVKTTEQVVRNRYPILKQQYDTLANSNIPVLLLIVDVKANKFYFARPSPDVSNKSQESSKIMIPLTEIDETTKMDLRESLAC